MNTKRLQQLLARGDELSPLKFKQKPKEVKHHRKISRNPYMHTIASSPQSHDGGCFQSAGKPIERAAQQPPTTALCKSEIDDSVTVFSTDIPTNFIVSPRVQGVFDSKHSSSIHTRGDTSNVVVRINQSLPRCLWKHPPVGGTSYRKRRNMTNESMEQDSLLEETNQQPLIENSINDSRLVGNSKDHLINSMFTIAEEKMQIINQRLPKTVQGHRSIHKGKEYSQQVQSRQNRYQTTNSSLDTMKMPQLQSKKNSQSISNIMPSHLSQHDAHTELQLLLDKQEMDLDTKRQKPCPAIDLFTRSRQLCQKAVDTSFEKFDIYAQALQQAAQKAQSSSQKDILMRILNGFKATAHDINESFKLQQNSFSKLVKDLQFQLKTCQKQFEQYKKENDMDAYFCKSMPMEGRKNLLIQIKELMECDQSWNEMDRSVIYEQTAKDASYELESIKNANSMLKQQMKTIIRTSQNNLDALPSHIFNEELENMQEQNLSKAVRVTGDVAMAFFNNQRRMMKHCETQTLSMEELFEDYQKRIHTLETELQHAKTSVEVSQKEMSRISSSFSSLQEQLGQATQDLEVSLAIQKELYEERLQNQQTIRELEGQKQSQMKVFQSQAKQIKEAEEVQKRKNKMILKMQKTQDKLADKLVQLGGPGILEQIHAECSTSDTEDENLSPTTRSDRRRRRNEQRGSISGETITVEGQSMQQLNKRGPNGEAILRNAQGKLFIKGPNGEMIECDMNGKPLVTKGAGGKSFIRGANGEMIECDASGKPMIITNADGKSFIRGANGEMIECDANGKPIQNGKKFIKGANGEIIECTADGKPVVVKGPGGKTYIKGANGELIECDADGKPIKGGKILKQKTIAGEKGGYKIKDGKMVFEDDSEDVSPGRKKTVRRVDSKGNVFYESVPARGGKGRRNDGKSYDQHGNLITEEMRDANGNLIVPGSKVRRRDDGTFSVQSDSELDSCSPMRKNAKLPNNMKQIKGAQRQGSLNIKMNQNKFGRNLQNIQNRQKDAVAQVDHSVQTDLMPLVALACEMLMHELSQNFNQSDADVMKRIKAMVDRIMAKCRQFGCSLPTLCGASIVPAQGEAKRDFVDMSAASAEQPKSWHFSSTKTQQFEQSKLKKRKTTKIVEFVDHAKKEKEQRLASQIDQNINIVRQKTQGAGTTTGTSLALDEISQSNFEYPGMDI